MRLTAMVCLMIEDMVQNTPKRSLDFSSSGTAEPFYRAHYWSCRKIIGPNHNRIIQLPPLFAQLTP